MSTESGLSNTFGSRLITDKIGNKPSPARIEVPPSTKSSVAVRPHQCHRVTEELAREHHRPATAATRLRAIQLAGMVRVATSPELGAEIGSHKRNSTTVFVRGIRKIARTISDRAKEVAERYLPPRRPHWGAQLA
jgi:hypothetical protein